MANKLTEEEKFEKLQNSTWAKWMERIFNMILLNLNFILYACLGLIVFGIGPSLLASYQIQKETSSEYNFTLFKEYFRAFKQNFIIGNLLFFGIWAIVLLVVININYYYQLNTILANVGLYVMGLCALLLIFLILVSFPIFAIYNQETIFNRIRITIYLVLINPLTLILLTIMVCGLCALFLLFPQFIMIFGFAAIETVIFNKVKAMILKMDNKIKKQNPQKGEENERKTVI